MSARRGEDGSSEGAALHEYGVGLPGLWPQGQDVGAGQWGQRTDPREPVRARQGLAKADVMARARSDYGLSNWRGLTHYLDDGNVPISNDAV